MVVYSLPERHQLELLRRSAPDLVQSKVLGLIDFQQQQLPIYAVTVGTAAPDKPVLLLTAGVHGLERIGTQVLLAFLEGRCAGHDLALDAPDWVLQQAGIFYADLQQ